MEKVKDDFVARLPDVADLRRWAKRRIPRFAFEYLDGGCNADVNLRRNCTDIQSIELMPEYLAAHDKSSMSTELFGETYDAPFGVAPIGLQGLMWPNSSAVLAHAAVRHNVPFILSTVSTASIEQIGQVTDGKFWFQLYHPAEETVLDDVLSRARQAGCKVLVALSDVPSFGYRPRDIRNGLAMPPSMSLRNIGQMLLRPEWVFNTLRYGKPEFQTLKPYMPPNLDLKALGKFMNDTFDGRLQEEKLAALREKWHGKLVVKGVVNKADADRCVRLGVDGIIVSNHGGRQLDAGESTIKPLTRLAREYRDKLVVMMDSGIRSGPDIARTIASGAAFTFMGRPFMYGVAALGERGGNHVMAMMKMQLQQVLEQLCCKTIDELPEHLIRSALD